MLKNITLSKTNQNLHKYSLHNSSNNNNSNDKKPNNEKNWFKNLSKDIQNKFALVSNIMRKNTPITAFEINKVLGTNISQQDLDKLLSSPFLCFDDRSNQKKNLCPKFE